MAASSVPLMPNPPGFQLSRMNLLLVFHWAPALSLCHLLMMLLVSRPFPGLPALPLLNSYTPLGVCQTLLPWESLLSILKLG